MTKPTELDAQLAATQAAGIPVVTIASGSSPHTLFDIQANEYQRETGKFQGVWASFDGQAFVIDDLLQQAGMKKGEIPLVSADGGQESFNRIRDPNYMLVATVAVPFELMGTKAVDAIDRIVAQGTSKEAVVQGPYMLLSSVLVDAHNVPAAGAWPW